jgi:hypothetical protein
MPHISANEREDLREDVLPVCRQNSGVYRGAREKRHDDNLAARRAVELIPEPLHIVEEPGPSPRLALVVAVVVDLMALVVTGLTGTGVKEQVRPSEVGDAGGNRYPKPVRYSVRVIQLEQHRPDLLLLRPELQLPDAGNRGRNYCIIVGLLRTRTAVHGGERRQRDF